MKCIKICLLLVINKDRCLFVGHSRLLICKLPVHSSCQLFCLTIGFFLVYLLMLFV